MKYVRWVAKRHEPGKGWALLREGEEWDPEWDALKRKVVDALTDEFPDFKFLNCCREWTPIDSPNIEVKVLSAKDSYGRDAFRIIFFAYWYGDKYTSDKPWSVEDNEVRDFLLSLDTILESLIDISLDIEKLTSEARSVLYSENPLSPGKLMLKLRGDSRFYSALAIASTRGVSGAISPGVSETFETVFRSLESVERAGASLGYAIIDIMKMRRALFHPLVCSKPPRGK